ncbi:unnamed protein product [Brassica rapa subsp. trilocularis]
MLLGEPSGDTVEVAVAFVKECGATLLEVSPRVFDIFRGILQEGDLEYTSKCLVESLVSINFENHKAIRPELDLLDEKVTHIISLFDEIDPETSLDVFKPDPEFHQNERKYEQLKRKILGEEEDHTETDLVSLRRKIYQTITSSLNYEDAGHKLLQLLRIKPGQEMELCVMILECCTEEITYRSFYEEDTTTFSRIFVKILFQELSEKLGVGLDEKLQDPAMEETFEPIFPKDHPKNMRFSMKFFTFIGLGGITGKLRQLLQALY